MYSLLSLLWFFPIHAVERDFSIDTANTSSTFKDFDPGSNLEDAETDCVDDDDSDGEMETSTDDTEDDENLVDNSESVHDVDEYLEPT